MQQILPSDMSGDRLAEGSRVDIRQGLSNLAKQLERKGEPIHRAMAKYLCQDVVRTLNDLKKVQEGIILEPKTRSPSCSIFRVVVGETVEEVDLSSRALAEYAQSRVKQQKIALDALREAKKNKLLLNTVYNDNPEEDFDGAEEKKTTTGVVVKKEKKDQKGQKDQKDRPASASSSATETGVAPSVAVRAKVKKEKVGRRVSVKTEGKAVAEDARQNRRLSVVEARQAKKEARAAGIRQARALKVQAAEEKKIDEEIAALAEEKAVVEMDESDSDIDDEEGEVELVKVTGGV